MSDTQHCLTCGSGDPAVRLHRHPNAQVPLWHRPELGDGDDDPGVQTEVCPNFFHDQPTCETCTKVACEAACPSFPYMRPGETLDDVNARLFPSQPSSPPGDGCCGCMEVSIESQQESVSTKTDSSVTEAGNRLHDHLHAMAGDPLDVQDAVALMDDLATIQAELDSQAAEIERLRESADRVMGLVDFCDDDEPCDLDHHGLCQAHGCGDWADRGDTPHCPTDALRIAVREYRALRGDK